MAAHAPAPDPTAAQGDPGSPAPAGRAAARGDLYPGRPETDPSATAEPGGRSYEDLPQRGTPQGPLSAGASEPGDMVGPDARTPETGDHATGDRAARAQEHPRADGTGYRG